MRQTGILLKLQFRALIAGLFRRKNGKKSTNPVILVLLGLLLFYVGAVFLGMSAMIAISLCGPLVEAGADAVYFGIFAVMAFAINVFLSARLTETRLFESTDNELLLAMPIPPRAILASRMLFLFLSDLLFTLIVLLPAGVVYLFYGRVSVLGVVAYFLGLMVLPCLSLALSCLIGWLLALVSSRLRNKSLLPTVLTLLFLGVYFAVYSQAQAILAMIVTNVEHSVQAIKTWLFPFWCFGAAITENPLWLLPVIAVSVIPFLLVLFILDRSFIMIATENRGAKKIQYKERRVKEANAVTAFRRREFSRLFSSAPYLINVGLSNVFFLAAGVFLLIRRDMMAGLGEQFSSFGMPAGLLPALMLGGALFLSSMALMGACEISIEGKTIWIAQTLPTDGRAPLLGKLSAALLFYFPAALFFSICAVFAMRPGVIWSLLLLLTPLVFLTFVTVLGLLMNISFPNLTWTDETAAVKQGSSILFTMLIGYGVIGVFAAASGFLSILIPLWIPVAVLTVLMGALTAILAHLLLGIGARRYLKLGE